MDPMPPATITTTGLPTLPAVAAALGGARDRLEEIARRYDREALADRVWIGVCCLAAREIHALDAAGKGKLGGRGNRAGKSLSRRDKLSEIDPDQPHPQGLMGWLAAAAPWLNRATAYKYMDAATGAGLTGWADLDEVRAWAERALARQDSLTLAALIAEGRKMLPSPKPQRPEAPGWEQLTFDSLAGWAATTDQVLSCREHMNARQSRIAQARAYEVLRELSGVPWGPADEDHPDLIAALREAKAGGY